MDISTATTLASGLVALIVPAFVQAFKKYIPSGYVGLVSLSASILFGVIAIAATGGFDGTYTWGIVLAGVVGVAQTVYTLVNQSFEGELAKEKLNQKNFLLFFFCYRCSRAKENKEALLQRLSRTKSRS